MCWQAQAFAQPRRWRDRLPKVLGIPELAPITAVRLHRIVTAVLVVVSPQMTIWAKLSRVLTLQQQQHVYMPFVLLVSCVRCNSNCSGTTSHAAHGHQ